MPPTLVSTDSIARRSNGPPDAFACPWMNVSLDAVWVQVASELDIATSPQLEQTLREVHTRGGLVVVDVREVTFMDSAGVHTIANASIRARQVDRQLILGRGPPQVDRMFALVGSVGDVEIVDLDPVKRSISTHPQLAEEDLAS